MTTHSLIAFDGKPILKGVALGPLFIYREKSFPKRNASHFNPQEEIANYQRALGITKKEILALLKRLSAANHLESASIFEAHLAILEDPLFKQEVETKIRESSFTAEQSLENCLENVFKVLQATQDPFFRERASDLQDLKIRIIYHLHGSEPKVPQDFHQAIVCVKEVTPSMAAQGALKGVRGFISLNGSSASHTSVVLKSRAIPHLIVEDLSILEPYEGKNILLDSTKGLLFVDPPFDLIDSYEAEVEHPLTIQQMGPDLHTKDGHKICIRSTFDGIEYSKELKNGIGLYRTEFLLLHDREIAFCEERQIVLYQSILEEVHPQKVVFRLFDLGGDKNFLHDPDPKRGRLRSVQYLLERSEILELQLSSLMKASKNTLLHILIPYVVSASELQEVHKEILHLQKKFHLSQEVRLGAMIESPLTSFELESILNVADFLAIGTNDLTQALIEIHRDSADFCLYQPALFKMIQEIVAKAKLAGKPVSVCGEIVSNPVFTELLLGLGATDFSCSFHEIPQIKQKILTSDWHKASQLAQKVCAASSSEEVKSLLS